ncbi:hypothetical protein PN499_21865 [Kamptonema animale CS-326]|uniref:hypothetical protein n=1 Tax=Kamptonema animale TaxID=92934 RepID=UPI00232C05D1|nr:hypothetical protein [Kamptonema animale]MDB9513849.1 hypothetical protein [Kamptonema animale CS-326]
MQKQNPVGILAVVGASTLWAIAASIEPLIAGILAWIWFGQNLAPLQIIGGVLIVGSISSLQIEQRIKGAIALRSE